MFAENIFNDILDKRTIRWNLSRVRTRDFGALFELRYKIDVNNEFDSKELIDELRCRNGNLNISLTSDIQDERVYN